MLSSESTEEDLRLFARKWLHNPPKDGINFKLDSRSDLEEVLPRLQKLADIIGTKVSVMDGQSLVMEIKPAK